MSDKSPISYSVGGALLVALQDYLDSHRGVSRAAVIAAAAAAWNERSDRLIQDLEVGPDQKIVSGQTTPTIFAEIQAAAAAAGLSSSAVLRCTLRQFLVEPVELEPKEPKKKTVRSVSCYACSGVDPDCKICEGTGRIVIDDSVLFTTTSAQTSALSKLAQMTGEPAVTHLRRAFHRYLISEGMLKE